MYLSNNVILLLHAHRAFIKHTVKKLKIPGQAPDESATVAAIWADFFAAKKNLFFEANHKQYPWFRAVISSPTVSNSSKSTDSNGILRIFDAFSVVPVVLGPYVRHPRSFIFMEPAASFVRRWVRLVVRACFSGRLLFYARLRRPGVLICIAYIITITIIE